MKKLMFILMLCVLTTAVIAAQTQPAEQAPAAQAGSKSGLLQTKTDKFVTREVIGHGKDRNEAVKDGIYRAIEQVRGVKVDTAAYEFSFSGTGAGVTADAPGNRRIDFDSVNVSTSGTANTTEIGGLVKGYEVLEEKKLDDGTYEVKLKVDVYDYGTSEQTKRVKIALMPVKTQQPTYSFLNTTIPAATLSELFTQRLVVGLTQTNKFAVLDRESINAFAKERNMLVSFDAPLREQARLIETLGGDYLFVGTITQASIERIDTYLETADYTKRQYKARFNLDYRLVDSATKQLVVASNVQKYLENEQVRKLADEQNPAEWDSAQVRDAFLKIVADEVIAAIIDRVYPVKIVAIQGDQIILNQGGDRMAKGMQFDVYSEGQEIFDTDTNESLGKIENLIATIEVQRVTNNMSFATIVKGDMANITKGLVCRAKGAKKAPEVGAKPNIKRTEQGGVKLPFD